MLSPIRRALIHGVNGLYRWLPIIMGCHCRADRSFYCRGMKFPVCARCTGIIAGVLLGTVTQGLYCPPWWAGLLLLVPLMADGLVQQHTAYESTNVRRLVTGVLFGYGLAALHVRLFGSAIALGCSWAASRGG